MSVAWITYYTMSEDDFQQAISERRGKSKTTVSQNLGE
jgi:hypothetical protein